MNQTGWNHYFINANSIRVHYVRHGDGVPIVLLHGWPEFWYTWHKNILPLAEHFDVIAPDLRGFGDTEKPALPIDQGYGLDIMVEDLKSMADGLGLGRFGIISHDVGSFITRNFALKYPERIVGLFFFDCPYPGIGKRFLDPDYQAECWYRSFNQLPWAVDMVGHSRETCRLYIAHFLRHWAHSPDAFEEEDIEAWVDNFMKPGNLQGGFNWYISYNAIRLQQIRKGRPSTPEKIEASTRMLWGENDAIFNIEWADGIEDYFTNVRLDTVAGAGHFMHYEMSEFSNHEIVTFFKGIAGQG